MVFFSRKKLPYLAHRQMERRSERFKKVGKGVTFTWSPEVCTEIEIIV